MFVDQIIVIIVINRSKSNNSESKSNPNETNVKEFALKSFLSQLSNEFYRKNIREKFVERRTQKQSEIRSREEEIAVIDDMIKFIDNYQLKHSSTSLRTFHHQSILPSTSTTIEQFSSQQQQQIQKTFLQGFTFEQENNEDFSLFSIEF